MTTSVPQLSHVVKPSYEWFLGLTHFTIQERAKEGRGQARRQRNMYRVKVMTPRTDSGAVPRRLIEMLDKYNEVRQYIVSNAVAHHQVERFGALTRRADVLFASYFAAEELTKTERDEVHYRGAIAAYSIIKGLEDLLRTLMAQAVQEGEGVYADAQARIALMERMAEAEDAAYEALASEYQHYLSSTRVKPELTV